MTADQQARIAYEGLDFPGAAERFEEAREFIDGATDDLPHMPLKRYNSKRTLEELLNYVDAAARLADNPSDADIGD